MNTSNSEVTVPTERGHHEYLTAAHSIVEDPVESHAHTKNHGMVVLSVLALTYAILRGLRSPNLWSATHALFNYDLGFVKRGLLGALLGYVHPEITYSYQFFFWFSFTIFAGNIAFLIALSARVLHKHRLFALVVLVYFTSAGPTFLAHTVGYFDQIGLLSVLIAIAIRAFWWRLLFAFISFSVVVLIHETGAIVFGPLLLFVLLEHTTPSWRTTPWLFALAIWMMLETLFVGSTRLSPTAVNAMLTSAQTYADFPVRSDAFEVLTRSLSENIELTARSWSNGLFVRATLWSLLVATPTVALSLWAASAILVRAGYSRALSLVLCAPGLAPLALNIVGWDSVRWSTLTMTTSFLLFLATTTRFYARQTLRPDERVSLAMRMLCLGSIVFNLLTSVALFDGFEMQSFPFLGHWDYLHNLLVGRDVFPSPPSRW